MSKNTTKKALLKLVRVEPITTREELQQVCIQTTRLTINRDAAALARDERILAITQECDPEIESMSREIEGNVSRMERWSRQHRDAEFKTPAGEPRQGIIVSGCELEFRKGTGKVVSEASDKASVASILSLPEEQEDRMEELLRIKTELDKESVKRIAKVKELTYEGRAMTGAEFLAALGLRVVVEEEFHFTPARTDLAPIAVVGGSTELSREEAA